VLDRLRAFFSSRTDIGDALTPLDLEAPAFDAALRNALTLSKRWLATPPVEMKSLVLDIVERVTIAVNRIDIRLDRAKIAAALEAGGGSQRPHIDPITLSIEAKLRSAGKGKRLVIANGAEAEVNAGLSHDWLQSPHTNLLAWWIPWIAIIAGLLVPVPVRTAIWIVALSWMGTACILNARRCGRTHCRYTGPYYLAMSAPVVALGSGLAADGFKNHGSS
jgi:hypothetical protein